MNVLRLILADAAVVLLAQTSTFFVFKFGLLFPTAVAVGLSLLIAGSAGATWVKLLRA